MRTLGIALNTEIDAPSQYMGVDLNSLTVFGDKIIGAGETGVMELSGDTDNGTEITAFFQVPSTDLGIPQQKKVRSVILSGYQHGNLDVTIICDNDEKTEYRINLTGPLDQSTVKVDLNSDDIGRFIGLLVENVEGSDFSIDVMDLLVLATALGPVVSTILGKHKVSFPLFTGVGVASIS